MTQVEKEREARRAMDAHEDDLTRRGYTVLWETADWPAIQRAGIPYETTDSHGRRWPMGRAEVSVAPCSRVVWLESWVHDLLAACREAKLGEQEKAHALHVVGKDPDLCRAMVTIGILGSSKSAITAWLRAQGRDDVMAVLYPREQAAKPQDERKPTKAERKRWRQSFWRIIEKKVGGVRGEP